MTVATGRPTQVRRGSVTIADCDRELALLVERLPILDGWDRADCRDAIDRWLEVRFDLAEHRDRLQAQDRSLA